MRARIEKYRPGEILDRAGNYEIGCLLVVQPTFFRPDEWVPIPNDWKHNIQRGTYYDLEEGEGRRLLDECLERARTRDVSLPLNEITRVGDPTGPRYGEAILVRPRLGQGTFRASVTDAYGRSCAVTGEHSLPALDAAHIRPYGDGGEHRVTNGLLLRSDIHRLFDHGYVTITSDRRFLVSSRLRDDFKNGRSYYPLHGQSVQLPARVTERPDPLQLGWHNEHRFLG